MSKVDVVLGLHWGDEGKGKIVDFLTEKYDIVARFQGGPNADHGIIYKGEEIVLRTIPSGIVYDDKICVIGSGMVINPIQLLQEIEMLESLGVPNIRERLFISEKAHIITTVHLEKEKIDSNGIMTTGSGIGPTYASKAERKGFRFIDYLSSPSKFRKRLSKFSSKVYNHYQLDNECIVNGVNGDNQLRRALGVLSDYNIVNIPYFINDKLKEGKSILAEGAQGTLLDIDNGTYPYVTSTNTTASAVCVSLGIGPNKIGKIYGIVKAYTTRIGNGQFPTELLNSAEGEILRRLGNEYADETPRRCGWLDLPALKYSTMVNGVTDLIVTKLDILDALESYKVCIAYTDLENEYDRFPTFPFKEEWKFYPVYASYSNSKELIPLIEKETNVNITIISDGPKRENTYYR